MLERTEYNTSRDFYENIRSLTGEKVISINPSSSISIECGTCNRYGDVNALLKINSPFQVKSTQIWLKAEKLTHVDAFIAKSDSQGQITDFQKFESTGNLTVSDVKWINKNEFMIGINYSGTFKHGDNEITASGLTAVYLPATSQLFLNK